MCAKATAVFFTVLAMSSPALGAEIVPDRASDYVAFCGKAENSDACASHILDRMWTLHWVRIFNPDQPGVTFCGPDVSGPDANSQIASAVAGWIAARPEQANRPTQDAADDALLALYPCKVPYAPLAN